MLERALLFNRRSGVCTSLGRISSMSCLWDLYVAQQFTGRPFFTTRDFGGAWCWRRSSSQQEKNQRGPHSRVHRTRQPRYEIKSLEESVTKLLFRTALVYTPSERAISHRVGTTVSATSPAHKCRPRLALPLGLHASHAP